MNYVMYYDFDNFDSIYECIPSVRNGVAFGMFDCIVKFYTMNDNQVTFWINGSNHTKKEAEGIFEKVSKLLSYLFALPIYGKENRHFEVEWCLQTNNMLSKKSMNTISLIEKSINKFSKNVLIIPNEGFRDKKGLFFPECTSEFYQFLKSTSEIKTEICIDDDKFEKLELHADIVYVATLIVQYAVLPIVTSMIASYLYDKVKSMNKEKDETNTNVHIIVEKNGKSKKIDYEGSIENFEETMKTVEKTIFK